MFSTSLSLILLPLETTIHGFNVLNFTPKIRFNVLNLEKISHLERRFGALKRHMGHPWERLVLALGDGERDKVSEAEGVGEGVRSL